MTQRQNHASAAKRAGDVAAAVIAHYAPNRDARPGKPGDGAGQEIGGRLAVLGGEDLHEGHPCGVIDGDMHILPAGPPRAHLAIAMDAMAHRPKAAEGWACAAAPDPRGAGSSPRSIADGQPAEQSARPATRSDGIE